MIRLLLIFTLSLASVSARAAGELYWTASERALIALSLKVAEKTPEEVAGYAQEIQRAHVESKKLAPRLVEVKSFEEFLKIQKEDPFFVESSLRDLKVAELLAQLRAVSYSSPSKRVENQIQKYFLARKKEFLKLGGLVTFTGLNVSVDAYKNNGVGMVQVQRYLNQGLDNFLAEMKLQDTPQVKLLVKVIKLYFQYLPLNYKMEMAYQLALQPLNMKPMDIFLSMVQNAGPQLQKLVQIKGRADDVPEAFKAVFQKLEKQVKKVPWSEVKKILAGEGITPDMFSYFGHDPLGVGTMAQTHRAQMTKNGIRKSFATRFIKPGISEWLEIDHEILKKIAISIDSDPELKIYNLPPMMQFVEDLHKMVMEEQIMALTVEQQNTGGKIYNRTELISINNQKLNLRFNVPKAFLFGKNNNLMGQELAFGQSAEKEVSLYKDSYPDLYRSIAEQTAQMWIEEAFFKSGFFHADLHQGNMMVQVTEAEVIVNLLDFGMAGNLPPELRESALMLAIGLQMGHADLITKHLFRVSKRTSRITEKQLGEAVRERLKMIASGAVTDTSALDWSTWAVTIGVEVDYQILKLNRGFSVLEVFLQDAKSPLTIETLAMRLALRNKSYLAKALLRENLLGRQEYTELAKQAFQSLGKKKAAILYCHQL